MPSSKEIAFLGSSLNDLKEFPDKPKSRLGYNLRKVQDGLEPDDWRTVPGLGKGITGVYELRERTEEGFYRVVYIANKGDCVYVLHAFKKKTNSIEQKDIKTIQERYKQI